MQMSLAAMHVGLTFQGRVGSGSELFDTIEMIGQACLPIQCIIIVCQVCSQDVQYLLTLSLLKPATAHFPITTICRPAPISLYFKSGNIISISIYNHICCVSSQKYNLLACVHRQLLIWSLKITDDLHDQIEWMKTNTGPTNKVQEYMKSTFEFRRGWIKNTERSVAEIVDEYPRLMDEGMVRKYNC